MAIIFDGKTGQFVNCANSPYPATSGVADPSGDKVVGLEYHDLQGRRVETPAPGEVYILTERLANGEARTTIHR